MFKSSQLKCELFFYICFMANVVSEENPNVKLVFTSQLKSKIYFLEDVHKLSSFRGLAAEAAQRCAKRNLTDVELKGLIREYKKAVNEQDIVKAHSIFQEMDYRVELICEENSLFDLAAIYYLVEGEDIEHPSEKFNKIKREYFEKELDMRAFFLLAGMNLTQRFSAEQGNDLLNYLEETRSISERIYRYISKET